MPHSRADLSEADRRVAEGEQIVADQHLRIAGQLRDGHDAHMSLRLLATFESTLRLMRGHRALIRREMDR